MSGVDPRISSWGSLKWTINNKQNLNSYFLIVVNIQSTGETEDASGCEWLNGIKEQTAFTSLKKSGLNHWKTAFFQEYMWLVLPLSVTISPNHTLSFIYGWKEEICSFRLTSVFFFCIPNIKQITSHYTMTVTDLWFWEKGL